MFEQMTYQQNLRDYGLTVDQVKECFNCFEAEIDESGNVWIAQPQNGHWLSESEYIALAKFMEARI